MRTASKHVATSGKVMSAEEVDRSKPWKTVPEKMCQNVPDSNGGPERI